MHVIVEGFDGTGKSTLCRLLSLAADWPVLQQSPSPPRSAAEYRARCASALDSSERLNLISDRWPAISNHCYELPGRGATVDEIVASLRDARVDRIVHCDVDDIADLRIEAGPGDARDAEQTEVVRVIAPRVLGAYRVLMDELRARGFHVVRHVMIKDCRDHV